MFEQRPPTPTSTMPPKKKGKKSKPEVTPTRVAATTPAPTTPTNKSDRQLLREMVQGMKDAENKVRLADGKPYCSTNSILKDSIEEDVGQQLTLIRSYKPTHVHVGISESKNCSVKVTYGEHVGKVGVVLEHRNKQWLKIEAWTGFIEVSNVSILLDGYGKAAREVDSNRKYHINVDDVTLDKTWEKKTKYYYENLPGVYLTGKLPNTNKKLVTYPYIWEFLARKKG